MTDGTRLISSVLFALGLLLVFIGLSAALHFTPGGMFASVAVIAALLYGGAIWFTSTAATTTTVPLPQSIIVFDRDRRIVAGPAVGQPLALQFPEPVEPLRRCLDGRQRAILVRARRDRPDIRCAAQSAPRMAPCSTASWWRRTRGRTPLPACSRSSSFALVG